MTIALYISAHGRFGIEPAAETVAAPLSAIAAARIEKAFAAGPESGLLHLATAELKTTLPPALAFARDFGRRYLTRLCHQTSIDSGVLEAVAVPGIEELHGLALAAPPMKGLEYLNADALVRAWHALDEYVRADAAHYAGGARAYLQAKNPLWRLVGRVTFHLAENKRDESHPFAFLATYAARVSERGEAQHLPLSRALQEYSGSTHRKQLVALLTPIREAAERLPWVQGLLESGDLYQALAWTVGEAHRFLRDVPVLEESGLIARIPNWWKPERPPRPQVSVRIGEKRQSALGADALLDFSVATTLGGERLSDSEIRALLASSDGLVRLRGQWVEVDGQKLKAALEHWQQIAREARSGSMSFFEGMRLLAGAGSEQAPPAQMEEALRQWSGVEPGDWLQELLSRLRDPGDGEGSAPPRLQARLRPYQASGVEWLRLLTGLGLGGCLADDMGLGKTIQAIGLLLHLKADRTKGTAKRDPSLIVAPASLIANWKAELARFAPTLSFSVVHPSEAGQPSNGEPDVVITTYGMVQRTPALRERRWRLVILDEAQAIKNPGTQQTRAIKQLQAASRIALTGTPVENRAGDLWSLFDFLNPGLLGDAKSFARIVKHLASDGQSYAPLRRLVQPYILRRLKTDRRVIADLPAKTEVRAFCGLSREQAALYEQRVRELAEKLAQTEGVQRRGTVLSYLMQLKQICNHPAQWESRGDYAPARSGKFERLSQLCEELAERQEKALIFTQFREIAEPLEAHLRQVFGRPGLVLHGGTAVAKRRGLVDAFQSEDGPPFFVLSLKAGGTGLNLTAASHVIHFDRWWNPAVENQATDRAFRIGQKRNVLVHKFVCRGTIEEKIDALIEEKTSLANDLLEGGSEKLLTEMGDRELLDLVALDIHKACGS